MQSALLDSTRSIECEYILRLKFTVLHFIQLFVCKLLYTREGEKECPDSEQSIGGEAALEAVEQTSCIDEPTKQKKGKRAS